MDELVNPEEEMMRVWVGLDPLQAKLMQSMLLDNGIECFSDADSGFIPVGELRRVGLWVRKRDERQARQLLEQTEEEMSAALDAEDESGETDS